MVCGSWTDRNRPGINKGEEGGVGQWRKAVENAQKSKDWTVHISDQLAGIFDGAGFTKSSHAELNLTEEVRFHLVTRIHEFVDGVIQDTAPDGHLSGVFNTRPRESKGLR